MSNKTVIHNFVRKPAIKQSITARKLVYGVGINDAWYMVCPRVDEKMRTCPYYKVWNEMLKRCYSDKYHKGKPTYTDCEVCSEWVYFSNFLKWAEKHDIKDKHLDKDIIKPYNKIYSPENCRFISSELNVLLTNCSCDKVVGVRFREDINKYQVRCSINGKRKSLGHYVCIIEAEIVYREVKRGLIIQAAKEQTDIALHDGLMSHACLYQDRIELLRSQL